jgi:hypothetical protein
MSQTYEAPITQPEELQAYSDAALLVAESRMQHGDSTPYAAFLCNRWGDPTFASPDIPPVFRQAPSGLTYGYNNPLNMLKNYSPQGIMLNARWAEGLDVTQHPEDYNTLLFVSTLDLRTGVTTDWRVAELFCNRLTGQQTIQLEADAPGQLWAVATPEGELSGSRSSNPIQAELARRHAINQHMLRASLTLNPQTGNTFTPPGGQPESLRRASDLVQEVNMLTECYSIPLGDTRERVGAYLADVIPLGARAA